MAKVKQAPTVDGKIKKGIRMYLWKLWYEKIAPLPPQSQRTQPAKHQVQAAVTPEIIHALAALEAAIAGGGDAQAIQTAFAALSQAERQAQWQTGETVPFAEQRAAWEQSMDELLSQYRTDPALTDGLALLRRTLRQPPHQPLDTVEVSAHALYRTFIQEGNGDVIRFAQQVANTNTCEEITANQDLIVWLAGMFGQRTATCVLPYIHRLRAEQAERERASVLGTDVDTGDEVLISQRERPQGFYSIGANGTGKSILKANLIKKDLELGLGLCLIEPHGDLVKTVLSLVPEHRLNDVILLDVMDSAFFFGVNLFQTDTPGDTIAEAKTASFLMHLFEKIWNVGTETPRLQQVLRNITRTLLANPGMTFAEIPLLLWDETVRQKLVSNVTTTQTQNFWKQYNSKSQRDKDELTASTMNKVDAFLSDPMFANIVSQSHTSINFRQIMDESKILLIQLSPQLEEISRLIGAVIIGQLLMAAFSRADQPPEERRQFNLYVDEFQRFATSDWRTFLEEARKFNVAISMAHQSITQLEESLQTAATGAGTIVVFRVPGEDSRVLASSFDATPTQEQTGVEPIRAPVTDVVSHLLRRGHTNPTIAKFVTDYLMPLDTLMKSFGHSNQTFDFGFSLFSSPYAIQGQSILNECLFEAMQSGRADGFIPPLALFTLGGAAEPGITDIFYDDIKRDPFFSGHAFLGLYESANRFGRASFLTNKKAVDELVKKHAKRKLYSTISISRVTTPGPSFIAMLKSLRQTMELLAKEPIMVDTGQYRPVFRQRSYADMTGEIANSLSQQDNYVARVKTLTGEHTIRTNPLHTHMTDVELAERIGDIKQRMREQGLCRPAHEVEEEVRLRHERLRQRNDAPPPTHTNRRRFRPRPPTDG